MTNAPELYRHRLSRTEIQEIPAEERNFLFGACHLANELNMLHKLALGSIRKGPDPETAIQEAQIAQTLFLLRLLSGKLNEGHVLLRKYYWGARLSLIYDPRLHSGAKGALSQIKRYFSKGSNLVTRVRNDYAFHYSPAASAVAMEALAQEEELVFYAAPFASNSLYYFAEQLAATAMLMEINQASLKSFLDDLTGLSKNFFLFIQGYLGAFLERFPKAIASGGPERVTLKTPTAFDAVEIPFFTTDPTD